MPKPDDHCRHCTDQAACGGHHVYVIELEDAARMHRPWRDRDVDHPARDLGVCLYVGMTAHRVGCRLEQHRAWADDLDGFWCGCFMGGQAVWRPFLGRAARGGAAPAGAEAAEAAEAAATGAPAGRTRGNRWAGTFARRLRPQFFWRHNPLASQEEALAREAALAEELRGDGYRVHQG